METLGPPEVPEPKPALEPARLILWELLDIVRPDWNGTGTKQWAERKLRELHLGTPEDMKPLPDNVFYIGDKKRKP